VFLCVQLAEEENEQRRRQEQMLLEKLEQEEQQEEAETKVRPVSETQTSSSQWPPIGLNQFIAPERWLGT